MSYDYSIIIPYWNKEYEINLVLKSLSIQDYNKLNFEVIIIDDGSDVKLDSLINKYRNLINIKYIYNKHTGNRSRNRNRGVDSSSGEWILFLDSDMLPEKNFLKKINAIIAGNEKIALFGCRERLLDFNKSYIDESVVEHNFDLIRNLPALKDDRIISINYLKKTGKVMLGSWQLCFSSCLCVSKKNFKAIGGFDEIFSKNWGAEDVELGYRLYKYGCNLKVNDEVFCYHLYHPENWATRVDSLRKNYTLFALKHQDWSIELFSKEFEIGPLEVIKIQEKIINHSFITNKFIDIDSIINSLPAKTVLYGIENKKLIESEKIHSAFIPESNIKSDKIVNILGIYTKFADDFFNCAIISEAYRKVNYGLFVKIINSAKRIAKKVIIIEDNDLSVPEKIKNHSPNNKPGEKFLLFHMSNIFHFSYIRYHFVNLSIACYKAGIKTGFQLVYNPYYKININTGYLKTRDEKKIKIINDIVHHELTFLADEIPCIMNSAAAQSSIRSFGNRIFWEEINMINHEKEFTGLIGKYEKFFFKRRWEYYLFPENLEKNILPVGIDKQKIELIKLTAQKKNKNEFVFMWSDLFTNNFSNLAMLLESFNEVFENNPAIKLKIITTNNYLPFYDSEYLSETMRANIENTFMQYRLYYAHYQEQLMNKYKFNKNIIFQPGVFDEEDYTAELYNSDCFIYLNSSLAINPLVLESVALGKKPLILDNQNYSGYIDDKNCFKIKTEKISALLGEDPILESIDINSKSYLRYCIIDRPSRDSIKENLLSIFSNKDEICIDKEEANHFSKQFDWITIADQLKQLL